MDHARFTLAFALLFAFAGCDDDDEERPRYQTGIETSGSRGVGDLDDGELRNICATFDAYVDAYVKFEEIAYIACLPAAIVLGGSPEGCERQLDECMALFPEPIAVRARLEDETVCVNSLRACNDASVAALEGCINVNLDLAFDILDNWSCRGAADNDMRAIAARAMDTANLCADVDVACRRFAALGGPD